MPTTRHLLALDPGLRNPAAALFTEGVLVCASRIKVKYDTGLPMAKRCADIARAARDWCQVLPDTLVVEWPQIYTAEKSKGDPNDLLPLAGIDAALAALFPESEILCPRPREWIGNLPKDEKGDPWKSPRGIRIRSRLSVQEIKAIVPSHDAIDSVGLGLWALDRFERRRVYDSD